jgi:hypothetical protein
MTLLPSSSLLVSFSCVDLSAPTRRQLLDYELWYCSASKTEHSWPAGQMAGNVKQQMAFVLFLFVAHTVEPSKLDNSR